MGPKAGAQSSCPRRWTPAFAGEQRDFVALSPIPSMRRCQMLEVLTDEMQREYVSGVTIDNWMAMIETLGLPIPA